MNTQIIKLRAWDIVSEKFSYWTMNDLCTWDTKDEKPSALEEWTRFTGLLDKNGKEIYEGDIISRTNSPTRKIVKWKQNWAGFDIRTNGHNNIEIIGNVYENPHP